MEKLKVYTAKLKGGSDLFATSVEYLLDTMKYELQNIEYDETWEFEFSTIYMTQEEIDSAGEFDGF